MHGDGDRITIQRDHEVDILRGICQRSFPKAFAIGRRFPGAMIAFVNGATQRDTGSLESAYVVTQIHQKSGVMGQFSQIRRQLSFQSNAASGVYPGLAEADGLGPSDGLITSGKQD